MSVYETTIEAQVGASIVAQTQSEPAGGAALSSERIYTGARRVYGVVIDNSLNSAISYLKFWDLAAPDMANDAPHMILKADGGTKVQYNFDVGVYFTTAIEAVVVTAGGTGGVTAPSGTMTVSYLLGA